MADQSQIRTYQASDCVIFKKTSGRFGGLSNMAPGFPLVVNGVPIRTSEALYQACRFPHMPEVQRRIIGQRSPMTAKMRSKPHRKNSRPDWNQIRVSVMRWCLQVKLAQHWDKFAELLLATENRPIVEESRKDNFWGAKPVKNGTLVGRNVLGRLLMELREKLRSPAKERLRYVSSPNIPNFLLYGEKVRDLDGLERMVDQNEFFAQRTVHASHKEDEQTLLRGTMIPKECKRLAEVDFPIAVVSKHSAREKSIRHGHPSTLHLWWARRPLAACRAMLLGLLLPDPCDPHCPEDFKIKAREVLPRVQGNPGPEDRDLRKGLLKFIGDFSNWDLSTNQAYLEVSRGLVKAAHPEETPLVVDPFAGGGSIPLEALRLGCETFASDLNPVACLILKVMLEDIPRRGSEFAEELRRVGKEMKEIAEKQLAQFYPVDPDGSKPIAYVWARTVKCESPNCGAEIPLLRSLWLCKNPNRKRALRYKIIREKSKVPIIEFQIFEPEAEMEVQTGTITKAKATCICCNSVLPPERVRAQLTAQHGGADVILDEKGNRIGGARMLAVITLRSETQFLQYRLSIPQDYEAVLKAKHSLKVIGTEPLPSGLSRVPDEPLPKEREKGNSGFRVLLYGMKTFGDLFTARQKMALLTINEIANSANIKNEAKRELLSIVLSRCSSFWSSLNTWVNSGEFVGNVFGRQALPIVWDFVEVVPTTTTSGGLDGAIDWVSRVVGIWPKGSTYGQVQIADATQPPLPEQTCDLWFTDPPYYDAIAYGDLSDFFYVWLKRSLQGHDLLHDPYDLSNPLTPKAQEIIKDPNRKINEHPKDGVFFETSMARVFYEGRRVLKNDGLGCVVFAHKSTEGWEALLSGIIKGGWTITGSWPIATERPGRLISQESAALATSVHLVCRPRPKDAPIGDWGEVLQELPKRVGDWMERLQSEGIRGADLVFACIGPALEIFSRYSKVETAEGREVGLPEFLEKVWEVVGRTALEQVLGTAEAKARNSTAGALEEDARLTALFLWTLQSTNGNGSKEEKEKDEDEEENEEEETPKKKKQGYSLIFDVVRRFAQPLGIHLPEWEGRVIETEKGVVRLLSIKERGKQLFGEESVTVAGFRIEEQARSDPQMKFDFVLGTESIVVPKIKGRRIKSPLPPFSKGGKGEEFAKGGKEGGFSKGGRVEDFAKGGKDAAGASAKAGTTTLDRVHAAMLLQSSGQTNALRALLKSEQERGPDFLRLANALSALYSKDNEEKRLLDAMLLAVPR